MIVPASLWRGMRCWTRGDIEDPALNNVYLAIAVQDSL